MAGGASAAKQVRNGVVVFSARPSGWQVYSVAVDGSGLRQASETLGIEYASFASWSPDMHHVAYSTVDGAVRVAAADGSADRPLDLGGSLDRPSWSADGLWVAYHRGLNPGEIWVAHPDGSAAHPIGSGVNPVWSPDGSSIAAGDGHELVVYDVATQASRIVATVAKTAILPQWAPNGREIVFTEADPAGLAGPTIHVAAADGSSARLLGSGWTAVWSPAGDRLAVMRRFYGPSPIDVIRPDGSLLAQIATDGRLTLSWSPDGREIAYATSESPNALLVVAPDGSSRHLVIAAQPNGIVGDVTWSPDGTRLLLTLAVPPPPPLADQHTQLFTLDPTTLALRRLTSDDAEHTQPSWSANGTKLTFVKTERGSQRIWVMNADGSQTRSVTRGIEPSLSTDGSRVLFVRNGRLLVSPSRGGRAHALRSGSFPAWSANGRLVAYLFHGALWTMRPDGTHPRRLLGSSRTAPLSGPPTWFANDQRIYVSSGPGGIAVSLNQSQPQLVDLSRASDGSVFDTSFTSGPSQDGQTFIVGRYNDGEARLLLVPAAAGAPAEQILKASYAALSGPMAWQPKP